VLSLLKFVKKTLKPNKEFNIVCLNDWHLGSHAVNHDLLAKITNFIDCNRDNTRILLNGDLFHNINKHSKGSMSDQCMTPQEQFDWAVEIFKPYADLIDGVVLGNHDIRTENETEIDIMLMFCKMIGIEKTYLKYRGIVGYSINKNFYSIEMYHGTGGGGTIASVERNLKRFKRSTADIMYCGHYHKEYAKPVKEYHIDPYNARTKEYKKWFLCGNTLVDTEKYAEKFAYDESFPSQAVIKLSGIRKQRNIEIEWIR
jgi:predicted MPP superfamily phosphohydrolase